MAQQQIPDMTLRLTLALYKRPSLHCCVQWGLQRSSSFSLFFLVKSDSFTVNELDSVDPMELSEREDRPPCDQTDSFHTRESSLVMVMFPVTGFPAEWWLQRIASYGCHCRNDPHPPDFRGELERMTQNKGFHIKYCPYELQKGSGSSVAHRQQCVARSGFCSVRQTVTLPALGLFEKNAAE